MKRQATSLFLAGALALLSMALPSCTEGCEECTCNDGGTTEIYSICRENYETQKQYKAMLNQIETNDLYGDCVCIKE